eukprot:jgi/Mesvir1/2122/Mv16650-RA.1
MAAATSTVSFKGFTGLRAATPLESKKSQDACAAFRSKAPVAPSRGNVTCMSLKALRERIASVKNTKKITDAMKLVAAAKVRRAQEAVVNGRPFSEQLVKVLFGVNEQLRNEDVDSPLTEVRPVKKVCLVVISGDRGLCGGYNTQVIKKAEMRYRELKAGGVDVTMVLIGKKGNTYFKSATRNIKFDISKMLEGSAAPTAKEAQVIADAVFSYFTTEAVDKVELVYTKFVSLIKAEPVVQTLLPMAPSGEVCDINGNCIDPSEDELFRLTTSGGKLEVQRDVQKIETASLDATLLFEQEPSQILDALLPLYLNSQILRALQEALASELAARMNAMSNASDNAKELRKTLDLVYNRRRQAKITSELIEICAGNI